MSCDKTTEGVFISHETLEDWTGRDLTPAEITKIGELMPMSTVPEAVATIADAISGQ